MYTHIYKHIIPQERAYSSSAVALTNLPGDRRLKLHAAQQERDRQNEGGKSEKAKEGRYRVASIVRLLKIIGLFCKKAP